MKITDIPFGPTDWSTIELTMYEGDTGFANWRTRQYLADLARLLIVD